LTISVFCYFRVLKTQQDMIKKIILPAVLSMCVAGVMAQKDKAPSLPDFGKVSKDELEMKECSFEKNAPAMMVFGKGISTYILRPGSMDDFIETEYHYRIKVFNKKGFDYANVKIPYRTDRKYVDFTSLKAQTYNLDAGGNVVVSKVDKAAIYDKKINKRVSEKTFAFPDVKEGSILEYSYKIKGAATSAWYFQKSIPVMISMFVADIATEIEMALVPNVSMPLRQFSDSKGGNKVTTYVMEQIPSLDDEPYMSCAEDYLQRMEIREVAYNFPGQPRQSRIRTWPGIIRDLMEDEDFGLQLKKNIPRTAELDALLKDMTDPYKKMVTIHHYVRSNMQWDDYYSILAQDGVKSAWKDKKGNTGEINMIMINLMRDADLAAHPVLVSTRDNGIINTGVAGYDQFNKVLAYVDIGDKHYVLDATDKYTPSNLIPFEVMASEGLVIEKLSSFEWGWRQLWDGQHLDYTNVFISGEIDNKHQMNCGAEVTAYDYARVKLAPSIKSGNAALEAKLVGSSGAKIEGLEVTNGTVDTLPLKQKFNFSLPTTSTGEYHYFSLNLFAGLEKNPFIADERKTDVFFGVNRSYKINATIFVPEGYEMDELPKNLKMITPDTTVVFTRTSFFRDDMLTVRMELDFKSPVFGVQEYEEFKEFYKKLFAMLNEQFVYRKKK
jgi:hypothetical protein